MTRDFADFLSPLNNAGARYVVIGGIAVLFHIPYRTTRDLDVLIEPTFDNARRVRDALIQWGAMDMRFSVEDFLSGDILSFGELLRVETHSRFPGAEWESVWARRIPGEFIGVPTFFASIDDLIAMKEAAGRPEKDRPDVRRLRRLRDRQSERLPD